mgnify:CR=1 FL=1
MSVMMYVSYIPQIMDNFSGQKGNFIQPLVAAINCSLWVYYGLFKKERDIPLAAANAPGILFGLVTDRFDSFAIKEDKTKLTC